MNRKDYTQKWKKNNREKVLKSNRAWRQKNKEKLKQIYKDWRDKNKEKIKEYRKRYKELHPEKMKKSRKKYKLLHPDKVKESSKKYKLLHPRPKKERIIKEPKKRIKGKKIRFEIFMRDNFTCQYCGRRVPEVILEIDHIKPQSKFSEIRLKKDNFTTACRDCNRGKGDIILQEFN